MFFINYIRRSNNALKDDENLWGNKMRTKEKIFKFEHKKKIMQETVNVYNRNYLMLSNWIRYIIQIQKLKTIKL